MVICFQKPAIASDLPQFPCHIFDISSSIPTSIFSTTRTYTVSSWPQMPGISPTTIFPKKMATYMHDQFCHLALDPEFPCPPIPLDIPSHGSIRMNQMVSVLVKAYQTPSMFFRCVSLSTIFRIKVPSGVNLIRLSEGLSAMESGTDLKQEAHLLESHPPAISSISDVPAVTLSQWTATCSTQRVSCSFSQRFSLCRAHRQCLGLICAHRWCLGLGF